jgi:hypothetical protein
MSESVREEGASNMSGVKRQGCHVLKPSTRLNEPPESVASMQQI